MRTWRGWSKRSADPGPASAVSPRAADVLPTRVGSEPPVWFYASVWVSIRLPCSLEQSDHSSSKRRCSRSKLGLLDNVRHPFFLSASRPERCAPQLQILSRSVCSSTTTSNVRHKPLTYKLLRSRRRYGSRWWGSETGKKRGNLS